MPLSFFRFALHSWHTFIVVDAYGKLVSQQLRKIERTTIHNAHLSSLEPL